MKHSFFHTAVVSILLYGCTTWTLTKRLEKKLDGNYTRMLWAILNKSWRQQPTKHQLYGHLPPITKTIQVRRTRHAEHCRRSRDELISDSLLWTPTYGRPKAGRPTQTYIQQLCEDTGGSPVAMNDREKWQERVRDTRASGTTLYIYIYIYIYIYDVCFCNPMSWGRRYDKYYTSDEKWNLLWWSVSRNGQSNFTGQGYILSFEGGTLLLREKVTMLRSRDVIHWGPSSF